MDKDQAQSDKFKETARELGCDEDEGRWDETVAKIVKQKPKEPEGDK
jgi:hypothetical protein